MQRIGFWVLWPLLKGLSLLPLWALYGISNLVYVALYHLIGYRKELVLKNLQRSFPEKSEQELRTIRKDFYHYLADLFLETIKGLSTGHAFINTHYKLLNADILHADMQSGQPVLVVLGHTGNWEWGSQAMGHAFKGRSLAPYAPLKNPYMSKAMERNRSRTGVKVLPRKELLPFLADFPEKYPMLILIADQSPNPNRYHLVQFMNQETAAVTGMEAIARKYGHKVYYASTARTSRGRYEVEFIPVPGDWKAKKEGSLTAAFMNLLENDIKKNPEQYLWSHNRWKLTTNRRH